MLMIKKDICVLHYEYDSNVNRSCFFHQSQNCVLSVTKQLIVTAIILTNHSALLTRLFTKHLAMMISSNHKAGFKRYQATIIRACANESLVASNLCIFRKMKKLQATFIFPACT